MKKIKDFQWYYATEDGQIWSERTHKFLTAYSSGKGKYLQVALRKDGKTKRMYVHRLVAQAFIDNPNPEEYTQVNHKNGIRTDNRVQNLEWVTPTLNLNAMNNIQVKLKILLQRAVRKQGYDKVLETLQTLCKEDK